MTQLEDSAKPPCRAAPRASKGCNASFALLLLLSASLPACVNDLEVGSLGAPAQEPSETSLATPDAAAADTTGPDAALACVPVRCRGPVLDCADCVDNDEDGLLDEQDPDCFGPCDDDESLLGDRACPEAACFFDIDCGEGNDATCSALTPNGCDCHGCCELAGRRILLSSVDAQGSPSCSSESIDDPSACQPCTADPSCENVCESCELCFGESTLDTSCQGDATCNLPSCPAGVAACSAECGAACAEGYACITGCCVDLRAAPAAL